MTVLSQFFAWPDGQIWGNVIAEPIIALLTLLVAGRWIRQAIRSHQSLHAKLDALHHSHQQIHAKLDALGDE